MSERSREDIVRFATNEVKVAEKKAKEAALARGASPFSFRCRDCYCAVVNRTAPEGIQGL